MNRKKKSRMILVHPDFYDKIESKRQEFMKKNGLNRLTTAAFTGVLEADIIKNGNRKKQKRRR